MSELFWEKIRDLAVRKASLRTKTNIPFQILDVSDHSIHICVSSDNEYTINRKNLEAAVKKLHSGEELAGPKDYKEKVADDRPSYAWAILKELGYIN